MTADEITKLLLDRNIILLFNENLGDEVTDEFHKKCTEWTKKALEAETAKYTFREWSVWQSDTTDIYMNIQNFTTRVLNLLQDIKDSDTHDQTILLDDSFMYLFAKICSSAMLSNLFYYSSRDQYQQLHYLQKLLVGGYKDRSFYYRPTEKDLQLIDQWNTLITVIFKCGNIKTITYSPTFLDELEMYAEQHHKSFNANSFARTMFFKDQLEDFLEDMMYDRQLSSPSSSSSKYGSVNNYLRSDAKLFVDLWWKFEDYDEAERASGDKDE